MFPPYTGGCIETENNVWKLTDSFLPTREGVSEAQDELQKSQEVSSLHGRVYRTKRFDKKIRKCFLPVREGVSEDFLQYRTLEVVSSLHGRVYRSYVYM